MYLSSQTKTGLNFQYTIVDLAGFATWCCENRELVPIFELYLSDARGRPSNTFDLFREALQNPVSQCTYFLIAVAHHDPLLPNSTRQDIASFFRFTLNTATMVGVLGGAVYVNGKFRNHGLATKCIQLLLRHVSDQQSTPFECHIGVLRNNLAAVKVYERLCTLYTGSGFLHTGDNDIIFKLKVSP